MNATATPNTLALAEPTGELVTVNRLEPLDEIAGPDQPHGPWLVVAIIPNTAFDRIVVIDEDGTEHDVTCRPNQLVRRRTA